MDFSRMQDLFTLTQLERIQSSAVAVFGLGGVGGYALEALARSGIGTFYLIDGDVIEPSNMNRQLLSLASTIGKAKVEVASVRLKEINEAVQVFTYCSMIKPDEKGDLHLQFLDEVDAIVDATDDIRLKASLAREAEKRECLIIAAGGTGNRVDSSAFRIEDIFQTSGCPLCRALRQHLRQLEVSHLPIVYAKDGQIIKNKEENTEQKKHFISSTAWTPAIAGLMMAEYVITHL